MRNHVFGLRATPSSGPQSKRRNDLLFSTGGAECETAAVVEAVHQPVRTMLYGHRLGRDETRVN
jgi:hypothetical protein